MHTTILVGHVLDRLGELPDASVHCCVTSPPYYGLRDYRTVPQVWGGNTGCEHAWGEQIENNRDYGYAPNAPSNLAGSKQSTNKGSTIGGKEGPTRGAFCRHCNAWRGHLGLEPTPDLYIAHLVEVFREVRRVLRDDGTLWLNIGDTYCNSDKWGGGGANTGKHTRKSDGTVASWEAVRRKWAKLPGVKPKDLLMVPALLALALRADGWYLRSDIIWHKPNPMPESVTDRPTQSHEHVFLLSKKPQYFYDAEAVKEEADQPNRKRNDIVGGSSYNERGQHGKGGEFTGAEMRNMRDVWTMQTEPFTGEHFATFPTEIPNRAILAGTSQKGVCPKCSAPWMRITETEYRRHEKWFGERQNVRHSRGQAGVAYDEPIATKTIDWQPSCQCNNAGDPVPAVVLDPFLGSGTTAVAAECFGRNTIGIELSPGYAKLAAKRVRALTGIIYQPVVELRLA